MTSKTKFTPGPWKLDGGTGKRGQLYVWSDRDERGKRYIGTYELCVAIVETNGRCEGGAVCWEEETQANANLIAAAPEMYEALEAANRALDKIERNEAVIITALRGSKDPGMAGAATALFEGLKRNLAHGRAALAKAKGEK